MQQPTQHFGVGSRMVPVGHRQMEQHAKAGAAGASILYYV